MGRTAQSLAGWLAPDATALRLVPDLDRIDALSDEREALWRRIGAADFLTGDEKREAVGYGPRSDNSGKAFNPAQLRVPAGNGRQSGRWTNWGGGDVSGQDALAAGAGNDELTTGAGPNDNQVNLATEDQTHPGRRSHPAAKHVGLSERDIAATIEADAATWLFTARYPVVGSFRDLESANRFVNEALIANRDLVERVKDGEFGTRARAVVHFLTRSRGLKAIRPMMRRCDFDKTLECGSLFKKTVRLVASGSSLLFH